MTGLPDNNSGNDFIRGLETRACINGMTKSDVERLKNALVKKILDDETVIEITEDGGIVADSDGLFIKLNGQQLGLSIDGEDIIPVTEPYLPEDSEENPLAPPNDTIMTSANIAVDPRIVRTTGNQEIAGNKNFTGVVTIPRPRFTPSFIIINANTWAKLYEFSPPSYGGGWAFNAFDSYDMYNLVNTEMRIKANQSTIGTGIIYNTNKLIGKMAHNVNGKWELWIKNVSSSTISLVLNVTYFSANAPVSNPVVGEEPVVGDTYSAVNDLTNS